MTADDIRPRFSESKNEWYYNDGGTRYRKRYLCRGKRNYQLALRRYYAILNPQEELPDDFKVVVQQPRLTVVKTFDDNEVPNVAKLTPPLNAAAFSSYSVD